MILATSIALLAFPASDRNQDAVERRADEPADLSAVAGQVAAEVAELRGKAFRGEVRVEVADRALFLQYAAKRMDQLHGPERMELDQSVAHLSGMIPLEMDLEQVILSVLEEQVGGFYEPASDTFFVMRGTDPELAPLIMAHELAHALDDQYHDLDGTDTRLANNSDALLAHHAVAEGSAQVVMSRWMEANAAKIDQAALAKLQEGMQSEALQLAPPFVWKPMIALYNQGQAFLQRRASFGLRLDRASFDDLESAFTRLPSSTEQILHPVKYWDPERRDEPVAVEFRSESLPEGWTAELEDTFGEMILALLCEPLEERKGMRLSPLATLNLRYTNEPAAGWGGDRYAYLRREGAEFLHLCTVWDDADEAEEFEQALDALSGQLAVRGAEDSLRGYSTRRVNPRRVDWSAWSGLKAGSGAALAGQLVGAFVVPELGDSGR